MVALVPGQDAVLLVLAHGQRAGITLGDRGYAPCHDGELRIIEVFEFRSQALMKRPAKLPDLHRVRIYLHGADPIPWCPDRTPEPAPHLRDQIDVLGERLMVIAEELGGRADSSRRNDRPSSTRSLSLAAALALTP